MGCDVNFEHAAVEVSCKNAAKLIWRQEEACLQLNVTSEHKRGIHAGLIAQCTISHVCHICVGGRRLM